MPSKEYGIQMLEGVMRCIHSLFFKSITKAKQAMKSFPNVYTDYERKGWTWASGTLAKLIGNLLTMVYVHRPGNR